MSGPLIKLAIIEDNAELSQAIAEFMRHTGLYEIIGEARDGEEGLRVIQKRKPDALIIDLVLPGKDGFYVLEEMQKLREEKPVCAVLSGVSLDTLTRKAFEKGADLYAVKPFDLALLSRRILELLEQKRPKQPAPEFWPQETTKDINTPSRLHSGAFRTTQSTPEDFILRVLHEIPIPNTLNGYTYLKLALLMTIEDAGMLVGITKRLYPAIAKKYNTSGQQVERAIRHAIHTAWEKGGGPNFVRLVGYGDSNAPKPTNSAFMSAVSELYQHTCTQRE